jgi:hypothetical protein
MNQTETPCKIKLNEEQQVKAAEALICLEREISSWVVDDKASLPPRDPWSTWRMLLADRLDRLRSLRNTLRDLGYFLVEKGDKRGWLRMDVWCVAFNETEDWHLDDNDMALIERIESIYYYDTTHATYLCEFTPSYEMAFVQYRVHFKPGVDDDDRDRIDQVVMSQFVEQNIVYYHCHEVDAIPEGPTKRHYGSPGVSFNDTPYGEQFDSLLEFFGGNDWP